MDWGKYERGECRFKICGLPDIFLDRNARHLKPGGLYPEYFKALIDGKDNLFVVACQPQNHDLSAAARLPLSAAPVTQDLSTARLPLYATPTQDPSSADLSGRLRELSSTAARQTSTFPHESIHLKSKVDESRRATVLRPESPI